MNQCAFSFFGIPQRTPKPRKTALAVGSDIALPLGHIEDFLKVNHDLVDIVKTADHLGLASRYTDDFWRKKLAVYHKYDVQLLIGGVPFELAFKQNKVDQYFETAKKLGFDAVEVSDDVIPQLDMKTRQSMIKKGVSAGLKIYSEIGSKNPDPNKPLDLKEATEFLQSDLAAGSTMVTIDESDILIFKQKNPSGLIDVINKIGLDKFLFEAGPTSSFKDLGVWMLRNFGREISIQNISLEDCVLLDAFRHGFGRAFEYEYLRR